jgi:sugar lactone lactonase YvrE
MTSVERAVAVSNHLGEAPVWSIREQAIYWVDLKLGMVHRWQPATKSKQVYNLGFAIGCLGLRKKGGLVMGTKNGFMFWDAQSGATPIANPIADEPGMRFNDGRIDPRGRFFAGTMHNTDTSLQMGNLYRLDPDGTVHVVDTNLLVPNGIGWSLDHKIMYFTDSPRRIIYSFDYDEATGAIANKRPFITVADTDGVPDGMTVDSEGGIWSAHWGAWKVTRYDPAGKVERVITMPVERPTSFAFGGKDLDALYITSAALNATAEDRAKQPFAGDLFVVYPGVKGQPEPEFAG